MSGLRVIRDGQEITIPIEIESEGGQVLADYEAAAFAQLAKQQAPEAPEADG